MQKRVLSLLVDNTAGVTTRVSGLFSRRGYNIDSITGGVTADERFSRITVVCSGDELILEQITNQLAKLVDVRDIKILEPDNSVCHELMMIKVAAKPEQRQGLISIADGRLRDSRTCTYRNDRFIKRFAGCNLFLMKRPEGFSECRKWKNISETVHI